MEKLWVTAAFSSTAAALIVRNFFETEKKIKHPIRAVYGAGDCARIQRAAQLKVHTMFVIGKRDMEADAVSVRVHSKGNLGAKPRHEVIADILLSINERRP